MSTDSPEDQEETPDIPRPTKARGAHGPRPKPQDDPDEVAYVPEWAEKMED